jgi:pyrimidine operon attenuation protein/uracil phosphoribosyltransferase
MTNREPEQSETTVVLNAEAVTAAIHRMALEIIAANEDIASLAFLGILSRGKPLADRLAAEVQRLTRIAPKVGILSTTLYRDDLRSGVLPAKLGTGQTHFDFNVDGATVILVDDVLAAGRTVRAALDEVIDYGRPKRIQLACLIDRGLRELPIQPDYCGWSIATQPQDHVSVQLREIDGEDVVLLEQAPHERTDEGA